MVKALSQIFRVPSLGLGIVQVLERNFTVFRYQPFNVFLSLVVEPMVFFWALAFGIGQYVGPIGGVNYVEYLVPGYLLLTAMTVSYFETSHGCFLKINKEGTYSNFLHTPMTLSEIALGEVVWGALKGLFATACIGLLALQQGYFNAEDLLPSLFILFLISIMFSALGVIVMTLAKTQDFFGYAYFFALLPMYLLSGALFPLDALPAELSQVSLLLPVTHAVRFFRSALARIYDDQFYLHFMVVVILTVCFLNLSVSRFLNRFRQA